MAADLSDGLTLPSGLHLANRIAKAPMTENLADGSQQPTERHERAYRRWAQGGAGLLVTGNLMVDRRFLERSRNIVADSHLDVDALARMRQASGEVPMIAQLSHPGRQCARWIAPTPVAPSRTDAVKVLGGFGKPRELSAPEIHTIVAGFAAAAARCEQAGMDGVQLHAAHGYLLAQFLSPATNQRTDEFGGDIANRARPLLNAVEAVRDATGAGFTIAVKLNSSDFRHGGFSPADAEEVVGMLARADVHLIEVSGGTYESPALLGLADEQHTDADHSANGDHAAFKEAYFAEFAARAKSIAPQVPIMLTGGLRTAAAMRALLAADAADLVGLGRPVALDPDLPNKLLAGEPGIELPTHSGPALLSMVGESEWYEAQIGRMGDGYEPDPELSNTKAALGFLSGEMRRGLVEGRARRRLASTARRA